MSKISGCMTVSTIAVLVCFSVSLEGCIPKSSVTLSSTSTPTATPTPSPTPTPTPTPISYRWVDGSGNIYIADGGNHRIRKITAATGIITTIAGTGVQGSSGIGGPATAAQLTYPSNISIDQSGNIYLAEVSGFYIKKISASDGTISIFAGTGVVGSSGNGGLATQAEIYPNAIEFDSHGNAYVADDYGQEIRKITPNGIISNFAASNDPLGIAIDSSDDLYVTDYSGSKVYKINGSNASVSIFAGDGVGGFSGDGGLATAAHINNPSDVVVDTSGNVYIGDFANNRVRKVNASDSKISTIAGGGVNSPAVGNNGLATSVQLGGPSALALDGNGNLYIALYYPGSTYIVKVNLSTLILTIVAGTGTAGFSGDGLSALGAQIDSPFSMNF